MALSSSQEAFSFDPPLYFSPTSTQHAGTAKVHVPFYRPPPSTPTYRSPDAQPETVPSRTLDSMVTPEEGKEEYQQVLASLKLSEKVHVAGFTREARYITHCLAGLPEAPPPQLLAHHQSFISQWGASQRRLSLKNKDGVVAGHEILMPQLIGERRGAPRPKHIANLILSTAENAVIPTLSNIRDRINQDTTICLIMPGLGLVEHLNSTLFPDPSTRPTFVLGHSGHAIARDSSNPEDLYSLQVANKGGLFLTGLSPKSSSIGTEVHLRDRIVRHARTQHLIKLLISAPGLNATGYCMDKFLRYKLPSMIFSAIANPISVALGFRYERIHTDHYAHRLWQNLWNETIAIVSALPELQHRPDIIRYFRGPNFQAEMNRHLRSQTGPSQWIAMVRNGRNLPIHILNGWFIGKAKESGVSCTYHRAIVNMVRAKEQARKEEFQSDIPLYHSPYMLDSDCSRNGEEGSKPAVRIVYTNK